MCWNKGRLRCKIAKVLYFCHLKKLVRPETFGPYYVFKTRNSYYPWNCIRQIPSLYLLLYTYYVVLPNLSCMLRWGHKTELSHTNFYTAYNPASLGMCHGNGSSFSFIRTKTGTHRCHMCVAREWRSTQCVHKFLSDRLLCIDQEIRARSVSFLPRFNNSVTYFSDLRFCSFHLHYIVCTPTS